MTTSLVLRQAQPEGCWNVRLDGVSAAKPLGWTFLLVVSLGATLYVGGGIVYRVRMAGAPARLSSHPHIHRFRQLQALCADGAAFVRHQQYKGNAQRKGQLSSTAGTPLIAADARQQDRGDRDSSGSDRHRQKSSKKAEKKASSSSSSRASRESSSAAVASVDGAPASAMAAAAAAPAFGTAAGGGGRWVHIPS